MKSAKVLTLALVLFFLFPLNTSAQVVINEVLNNPAGEEKGAEWVELYNLNASAQSLKNCSLLLDDSSQSQKVNFAEEDFVDKFKVVSWDESWLNNQGDAITLACPNFSDTVSYGDAAGSVVDKPAEGKTFGRSPDGTGSFSLLGSVTLGSSNSLPPSFTPTQTPTITATPRPTSTPRPATQMPAEKISTPTTYIIKVIIPSTTMTPTIMEKEESVLSASDEVSLQGITQNPLSEEKLEKGPEKRELSDSKSNVNPYALLVIAGGVLILFFTLFRVINEVKKDYNLESDEKNK